jgi:hypothetical protein
MRSSQPRDADLIKNAMNWTLWQSIRRNRDCFKEKVINSAFFEISITKIQFIAFFDGLESQARVVTFIVRKF